MRLLQESKYILITIIYNMHSIVSLVAIFMYVKSPTLDERWLEDMFISRGNPHLTSWFRKIELGPTQNSKNMYSNVLSFFCINHVSSVCNCGK
jgi:hypothetical protein